MDAECLGYCLLGKALLLERVQLCGCRRQDVVGRRDVGAGLFAASEEKPLSVHVSKRSLPVRVVPLLSHQPGMERTMLLTLLSKSGHRLRVGFAEWIKRVHGELLTVAVDGGERRVALPVRLRHFCDRTIVWNR